MKGDQGGGGVSRDVEHLMIARRKEEAGLQNIKRDLSADGVCEAVIREGGPKRVDERRADFVDLRSPA